MENVAGEQGLPLQQSFPSKFLILLKIQTAIEARGLKLGHFDIFDMPFSFLAFLKLQPTIV